MRINISSIKAQRSLVAGVAREIAAINNKEASAIKNNLTDNNHGVTAFITLARYSLFYAQKSSILPQA